MENIEKRKEQEIASKKLDGFIEKYFSILYLYAYRVVNQYTKNDVKLIAQDLIQNVFEKIYHIFLNKPNFIEEGNFLPYAKVIINKSAYYRAQSIIVKKVELEYLVEEEILTIKNKIVNIERRILEAVYYLPISVNYSYKLTSKFVSLTLYHVYSFLIKIEEIIFIAVRSTLKRKKYKLRHIYYI